MLQNYFKVEYRTSRKVKEHEKELHFVIRYKGETILINTFNFILNNVSNLLVSS